MMAPDTSYSYRECLGYCYFHIIERELKHFCEHWKSHYIRKSHGAACPAGVPEDLHLLPELTGKYYNNYILIAIVVMIISCCTCP